jgi:hypothetical protein
MMCDYLPIKNMVIFHGTGVFSGESQDYNAFHA